MIGLPSRRAALAAFALLLPMVSATGCGPTARSREVGIEELRRRAAERSSDPDAWLALAEGELLGSGGDPIRARAAVARARELRGPEPTLAYLSGLERDLHGDAPAALTEYLRALEAAVAANDEGGAVEAAAIAEAAVGAVATLEGQVAGYRETIGPVLDRVASAARVPFSVRQTTADLRARLAFARGEPDEARAIAEAQGCLRTWRVAGPFGPRDLRGWNAPSPALVALRDASTWPDRVDLGPGRGERPVRSHEARGCAAHLGSDVIAAGGTTLTEAVFETRSTEPHLIRIETPNAFRAYVDGRLVLEADRIHETGPSVHYAPALVEEGRHRLVVAVTTRHPNPVLLVALGPAGEAEAQLPPGRQTHLGAFLRASLSFARGDVVDAREVLLPYAEDPDASPLLLSLAANVALADPLRPADVRRDDARGLLRAARRDPGAWYPVLQGASLAAADGQDIEAIGVLREARTRWPGRPAIDLALVELLVARGWDAEAREVTGELAKAFPDSCAVLSAALGVEERRDRIEQAEALAGELAACDRQSNVRFRRLVAARNWDEAAAELDRLATFEPPQDAEVVLRARLDLARAKGDEAHVDALLTELRRTVPRDAYVHRAQVDRWLAQGDRPQALRALDVELGADPAAMAPLFRLRRALGGDDDLMPYRLDGVAAVAAFESSGRRYDAPQVLVLDYQAVRVYPDGSSRSLVHQIYKVQSEEAVDSLGEFEPPDGADLLTLRTIKADGRPLEPDTIAGKSAISLPSVAVGDYVEYEHVTTQSPSETFPDGWLGGRFYFRSFEIPFDRSELVVLLPETFEPVVDPRGNAPVLEERIDGGLRVMRWMVEGSRALAPEPLSVSPREFIPSVQVGVSAGWVPYVEMLQDLLEDKNVADPRARRLVEAVLGDEVDASPERRAEILYGWVLDEIEATDSAFGLAPAMLAERTGHLSRLVHYLLGIAGVRAELLLARSYDADQTRSDLADDETYRHLLIRLPDLDPPRVLFPGSRWTPFGYVPAAFRGQDALVIGKPGRLVDVPDVPPSADRRTISAEVRLRDDGSALARVSERYVGAQAQSWREGLESIPRAMREQRFEELYVSQLVRGAELDTLTIEGERDRELPLDLRYGLEVSNLGRASGAFWQVPGLFPSRLAPVLAATGSRTTTQLVGAPIDVTVEVQTRPPDGIALPEARAPIEIEGPGDARFSRVETHENGALVVRRHLVVPAMRIAPNEYRSFAEFCRAVDEAEALESRFGMRPSRFERLENAVEP